MKKCELDLLRESDKMGILAILKRMGYSEEEISESVGLHSLPNWKDRLIGIDIYMYWGTPKSKKCCTITLNGVISHA